LTGPRCTVASVVKANGYGLGMTPVAEALASAGCRWFFVALPEEAVTLASALDERDVKIGVLSGPLPGSIPALCQSDAIIPVLNDLEQLERWRRGATGRPALLQFDTGMSRLGFPRSEAARLATEPALTNGVPILGAMSHLGCSDQRDHPMNETQRLRFEELCSHFHLPIRSLAASYGVFLGSPYHFEMVRCGAALYGINPCADRPNPMCAVVDLKARIVEVQDVEAGATVGYGACFTATGPRRIATLGIGYADGVPWSAADRACFSIEGYKLPVLGRISMDLTSVDVTGVPEALVQPGKLVTAIGGPDGLDRLAHDSGTIGYEVLARLGSRVARIYRRGQAH
jgi:alanine racemase